jgi:hypothetical protein
MNFRIAIILVWVWAGCLCAETLHAQKKGAKKQPAQKVPEKTEAAPKVVRNFLPDVYLGASDYRGGVIRKPAFDSLLKMGLRSRDSLGNKYQVQGFDFTYGERNIYEDSAANLQLITDYQLEYCPGDTVSRGISSSIYERTKAGDTIFIDKIRVARLRGDVPDSITIVGRPMKCVIVK